MTTQRQPTEDIEILQPVIRPPEDIEALEPAAPPPELTPEETQLETELLDTLRRLYPRSFEPEASFGFTEEQIPMQVIEQVASFADSDPEQFLKDLLARGSRGDIAVVLSALGASEADVVEITAGVPSALPIAPRRESQAEIDAKMIRFGVPPEEVSKINEMNKLELSSEEWREQFLSISPSALKSIQFSATGSSLAAGLGDVVQAGAGLAGLAKQEELRDNMLSMAEVLQSNAPPVEPWEPTLATVLDPRFWQTTVARALPFTLSLVPLSILAAYGAVPVAGAVGLGTYGTFILQAIFAGVAQSVLEASFEGGVAYNSGIDKGFSHDKSADAAQSVFFKNVTTLSATNAVQFFAAFLPAPARTLNNLITRGLVTVVRVGGRVTITGLTEGGEEVVQDIWQRQALGEKVEWDDELKMTFILGNILGIALGGAGDILTTINQRVVNALPEDIETEYLREKAALIDEGLTEEQASLRALDVVADTKEGQALIEDIVQKTEREEVIKNIKPQNATEAQAWEHLREQTIKGLDKAVTEVSLEQQIRDVYTPEKADAARAALNAIIRGSFDQVVTREGRLDAHIRSLEAAGFDTSRFNLPVAKNLTTREQFSQMVEEANVFFRALNKVENELGRPISEEVIAPIPEITEREIVFAEEVVPVEPIPEITAEEGVVIEPVTLSELQSAIREGVTGPELDALIARSKPEPTVQQPIDQPVPKVTQKANDTSIVNVVREDAALPVPEDTVKKLTDLIKQAVPIREIQEGLKHEELVRRSGRASDILDSAEGREAFARSKSALRGELPKAEFAPPELQMTDQEIKGLFNQIKDSELQFFQKLNTAEALEKLLAGTLPARFEIQRLENMFGSALAKAILDKRPGGAKAWENILEAMNLPRAVLASWDLSAPLRQGALLFWGQPAQSLPALKPMVQAFASERLTKIIDENIKAGKFAELREQAGLFQADIFSESLGLTAREENFMSRTVQKLPDLLENLAGRKILPITKPIAEIIRVIRRSERAFATYLNKLRADVFDSYAQQWEGIGKTLKDYKDLANVINIMTGRGPLGALSKSAPILSAGFFSPRLQAARVTLVPVTIKAFATKSAVRKILARNIIAFVSANFTIMTLAVLAGADVEDDPRSADRGKIKIGNTR